MWEEEEEELMTDNLEEGIDWVFDNIFLDSLDLPQQPPPQSLRSSQTNGVSSSAVCTVQFFFIIWF